MTLYELEGQYLALLEMAEDPEVDLDVLADTMEAVDGEIEMKAEGYAKVMKQLESESAALKAEIARLQARKKSLENSTTRIKQTLEYAMKLTGKTKFKTELFSFNIQKNPASLVVANNVDTFSLPAEYIIEQAPTINTAAVKDALKKGIELEWAHLEQGESLRIR